MPASPHGGRLVEVRQVSATSPEFGGFSGQSKLTVDNETRKTVWNIANGVFSPLDGFLGESDYRCVLDQMRLANDVAWTLPILLLTDKVNGAREGDDLLLVGEGDAPVAIMNVQGSFAIDRKEHSKKVYGTEDAAHPGVSRIMNGPETALAGKISAVAKPDYGPYSDFTLTPRETRVLFTEKGWKSIVAFQTRNAPHINHEYLQKSALGLVDGLFVNPVLGRKKPGDFRDEVIVATYKALIDNYYPRNSVVMSVLHYDMQYAGPKEAIMHSIMRKNFGGTHMLIGRDHAGVGNFYGPYAAQEIFYEFPDLGVSTMFFKEFYYCKRCAGIASEKTCPHSEEDRLSFSGTKLRKMFSEGEVPPKEFMRPEVAQAIMSFKEPFVS